MATEKMQHNAAKHAFFYLTSFFALGLAATAIGSLLFEIINVSIPQSGLAYADQISQSAITFGISSLLIAAPVFYFTTRIINRSLSKKDLDLDSGIRRWLTYIVMFITAATVIGDLIAVANSFLMGELSIRFFLKALVIFLIAGGIFLYYFTDMRNESIESRRKKNSIWSAIFWAAVIIPFVWALFVMDSPQVARQKNIDRETSSYLESARSAVEYYASTEQQLPETIDQAEAIQPGGIYGLDTLQKRGFTYRSVSENQYELCADFQRDNRSDADTSPYGGEWLHPQGKYCFTLTVAKNQIKPTVPNIDIEG